MSNIELTRTKEVVICGDNVTAIRDGRTGEIFVPVGMICDSLCMSEGQKHHQLAKVQGDEVLAKGVRKIVYLSRGGEQEATCIESKFIPLWLAKINPNTIKDFALREKLVNYQLEAKDVLAKAFAAPANVTEDGRLLPTTRAKQILLDEIEVAEALNVPRHIAETEAIKHARKETGVDYSNLLAASPAQKHIEDEDKMLEPSEIGRRLGIPGTPQKRGRIINKFLEEIGWQRYRDGAWCAVGDGCRHSANHHWTKGSKSGYNLIWRVERVTRAWNREYYR